MRRAAAKLGLTLADRISIAGGRRSLLMRRSLSGLASGMQPGSESTMELGLSSEKKNLYLCFVEKSYWGKGEHYLSQVVRPIKLRLNSDDDGEDEIEDEDEYCNCKFLRVAAYKWSELNYGYKDDYFQRNKEKKPIAGRFGSKIVFPAATSTQSGPITHYHCIDTCLEFQSETFSTRKYNPIMGGLNGKLYCIDSCPYSDNPNLFRPFEVLDQAEWRPLDHPPFINGSCNKFNVSFLEGSNKIIGWELGKKGVYCFDTTQPGNGWTESFSQLGSTLPFLESDHIDSYFHDYYRLAPPIFVHDHHPFLGSFHLTFIFDSSDGDKSIVTPFFMSDSHESFHACTPLRLPQINFDEFYYDDYGNGAPDPSVDAQFIHLGDQKVCLVLNVLYGYSYVPTEHDHLKDTRLVLLITFKYEIVTTIINHSKPTIKVQTRLLRTRRFGYRSRQMRKPGRTAQTGSTKTYSVHMTGAFLI